MLLLQVHHRSYDRATLTGENIDALTVACRRCHCLAEKPGMVRSAYDRLSSASEFLMTTTPDHADRIAAWYSKNRGWLDRHYQSPEHALDVFRHRATHPAGTRCLLCGSKRRVIHGLEPKTVGTYHFCAPHSWHSIKIAIQALELSA